MSPPKIPSQIGRFQVLRPLGEGAQSVVYLAEDPHLQRRVAIKTVHLAGGEDHAQRTQALIAEARTVSKLQHPNIVPIFEAGEHEGNPYLVFEYVEGHDLAQLLRKQGALAVNRALEIGIRILDAIGYAHQHQLIHRDMKPSNILMNAEGVPRVMDFGIAKRVSDGAGTSSESTLMGTPAYMAPEYIERMELGPGADIFAIGMILYQMLTGEPAVRGGDVRDILRRVVKEPFTPPSKQNPQVDEKLDDIVLKALAKNPLDRFESAREMKAALERYLTPAETSEPSAETRKSTLDFLLRRMRHKSDFPALGESVTAINRIVSSEQESVTRLSNAILKDVALTTKLLRLVNAAFYSQFGGGMISTVSRAAVILGFDAVRTAALTLVLLEHLQNKANANQLKDEFVRALFGAVIAKELATKTGSRNLEEAFICAMFHNLGRLLTMFYLPEEADEIRKTMAQRGMSEDSAAASVLGISFEDLGIGVSEAWNFPDLITQSIRKPPAGTVKKSVTAADRMQALSAFSSELCESLAHDTAEERNKAMAALVKRFGASLPVSEKSIMALVEFSMSEVSRYSGALQLNLQQTAFGRQLKTATTGIAEEAPAPAGSEHRTADGITLLDAPHPVGAAEETAATGSPAAEAQGTLIVVDEARPDAQAILAEGIQDITNSLVEGRSLNDILRMTLEIMYTGIGFTRVLLCLKDARQSAMIGRTGFGRDIAEILKAFRFPLEFVPDVFHVALNKNVDIVIEDIDDPKIKSRVPDWYRKAVPAQTFVVFPVVIKNVPVAMIYADKDRAGEIRLSEKELNLLRVLRNQAILAIRQQP